MSMKNTKKQLVEMVEEFEGEKEFWSNEYHDLKMKVDWGSLEDYCSRIDELITKNNEKYKEVEELRKKNKDLSDFRDAQAVGFSKLNEEIDELKKENKELVEKTPPSNQKLKKQIRELKAEKESREIHNGCIDKEIDEVEKLMRIFSDFDVDQQDLSCLGCRLKTFHAFTIAVIRDNKAMQKKLVALCEPESVAATAE